MIIAGVVFVTGVVFVDCCDVAFVANVVVFVFVCLYCVFIVCFCFPFPFVGLAIIFNSILLLIS